MRVLTYTTLYPNEAQPTYALFVEHRMRSYSALGLGRVRVVAPVPWFPLAHAAFGRYATFARVPAAERRHDIPIAHPRYVVIPKVGMKLAPALLEAGSRRTVERELDEHGFDVIDAHFFYPDGIAAFEERPVLHGVVEA